MAQSLIQFVGDDRSLQIDGVKLLGLDLNNGRKLLFTVIFFLFLGAGLAFALQKVVTSLAGYFAARHSTSAIESAWVECGAT